MVIESMYMPVEVTLAGEETAVSSVAMRKIDKTALTETYVTNKTERRDKTARTAYASANAKLFSGPSTSKKSNAAAPAMPHWSGAVSTPAIASATLTVEGEPSTTTTRGQGTTRVLQYLACTPTPATRVAVTAAMLVVAAETHTCSTTKRG